MSDQDPANEARPCGDSAPTSSAGKSEAAAPAAGVGRRLSELRLLSPCLFGFAFVRAYYDIMASKLAELDVTLPWLGQDIMALGMLPVFAGCIVASRKALPLYRHREIPIVATLLMLAASALLTVAISLPEQASLLMATSALFAGTGFGISILLWAELQSCSNSFLVVLYVSGSFFLGSCLGWFIEDSSGPRLCAALVMLPLLSLICLRFGFAKTQADVLPGGFTGDLKFPWRLVCALGVYELALGFRQGAGSFVGGAFTAGVAVASAAIFLIAYFLSHRFDFTYVYRTPFVLMSCGLLATLVSFSSRNLAADVLISTGYSLMFVLLDDPAMRHRAPFRHFGGAALQHRRARDVCQRSGSRTVIRPGAEALSTFSRERNGPARHPLGACHRGERDPSDRQGILPLGNLSVWHGRPPREKDAPGPAFRAMQGPGGAFWLKPTGKGGA